MALCPFELNEHGTSHIQWKNSGLCPFELNEHGTSHTVEEQWLVSI